MAISRGDLNRQGHDPYPTEPEKPSMDEWVLSILQEHGTQTLDRLGALLPHVNWAQLFLAIDRLSRSGHIALWSPGFGDYLITANSGQRPVSITTRQPRTKSSRRQKQAG
jgi:hypothetical protein